MRLYFFREVTPVDFAPPARCLLGHDSRLSTVLPAMNLAVPSCMWLSPTLPTLGSCPTLPIQLLPPRDLSRRRTIALYQLSYPGEPGAGLEPATSPLREEVPPPVAPRRLREGRRKTPPTSSGERVLVELVVGVVVTGTFHLAAHLAHGVGVDREPRIETLVEEMHRP